MRRSVAARSLERSARTRGWCRSQARWCDFVRVGASSVAQCAERLSRQCGRPRLTSQMGRASVRPTSSGDSGPSRADARRTSLRALEVRVAAGASRDEIRCAQHWERSAHGAITCARTSRPARYASGRKRGAARYDALTRSFSTSQRGCDCATRRGSSAARAFQIGVHENHMHSRRCMIDAEQRTILSSMGG
jgi:hypothetical protein